MRIEIDYLAEVAAGTVVEIYGAVTRIGRTSVELAMEMRKLHNGEVAARLVAKTVFFDLVARKATPITDEMRARAEAQTPAKT